jgi:hypothetical protein
MTLEEMDLHVPLTQQLGDGHIGPVVLINKFHRRARRLRGPDHCMDG